MNELQSKVAICRVYNSDKKNCFNKFLLVVYKVGFYVKKSE